MTHMLAISLSMSRYPGKQTLYQTNERCKNIAGATALYAKPRIIRSAKYRSEGFSSPACTSRVTQHKGLQATHPSTFTEAVDARKMKSMLAGSSEEPVIWCCKPMLYHIEPSSVAEGHGTALISGLDVILREGTYCFKSVFTGFWCVYGHPQVFKMLRNFCSS